PSRGALPGGMMLLLSRAEVARLMDFAGYVDAVEAGFLAAAGDKALAPPAAAFHVPGGSYHAQAEALLAGEPPTMALKLTRLHRPPNAQSHLLHLQAPNRPSACADAFDRVHHHPHRPRPHLGGPPPRAPGLARRHDLRRRRAGPYPGPGDRGCRQARYDPCLGHPARGRPETGGRAPPGPPGPRPAERRPRPDPPRRHRRDPATGRGC